MNENELKEIKEILRHIHNDVENLKRELITHDFRLNCFAGFVMGGFSSGQIDHVENPDRKELKLDELYSPCDEIDKAKWEEHLKKENEVK